MFLFTDGRYLVQAKQEISLWAGDSIIVHDNQRLQEVLSQRAWAGLRIGYDPMSIAIQTLDRYVGVAMNCGFELVPLSSAIIGNVGSISQFLEQDPLEPLSTPSAYILGDEHTGKSSKQKITDVLESSKRLANEEGTHILITDPASICWLLNIRSHDVEHTPLVLAYGLLDLKTCKITLFCQNLDVVAHLKGRLNDVVQSIHHIDKVRHKFIELKNAVVLCDPRATPTWFLQNQGSGIKLVCAEDPTVSMRSRKNSVELKNIQAAHICDAVALCRFLVWLDETTRTETELSELKASQKLLEFRYQQESFLFSSFNTISAYGENAAIIHYHPTKMSNKNFKYSESALYLCDSGGQYHYGTTDVTRTIAIGPAHESERDRSIRAQHKLYFTAVLRGHIDVANAKFPQKTSGAHLDSFARKYLWELGQDYPHGTGHGVGYFMSVHEGPQTIGKNGHTELLPGMIVSIEPGFYKEGEYGIRIENLYVVSKCADLDGFLEFEPLTLAPIDPELIEFSMLTREQRAWLLKYHQTIKERVFPYLEAHTIQGLETRYFNKLKELQ